MRNCKAKGERGETCRSHMQIQLLHTWVLTSVLWCSWFHSAADTWMTMQVVLLTFTPSFSLLLLPLSWAKCSFRAFSEVLVLHYTRLCMSESVSLTVQIRKTKRTWANLSSTHTHTDTHILYSHSLLILWICKVHFDTWVKYSVQIHFDQQVNCTRWSKLLPTQLPLRKKQFSFKLFIFTHVFPLFTLFPSFTS